jgi:hypothetical protein
LPGRGGAGLFAFTPSGEVVRPSSSSVTWATAVSSFATIIRADAKLALTMLGYWAPTKPPIAGVRHHHPFATVGASNHTTVLRPEKFLQKIAHPYPPSSRSYGKASEPRSRVSCQAMRRKIE